ncbi:hypothetical protein M569_10574, partial [Genlisea aurea]
RGDDLKRINIGAMSQSELLALSSGFSSSFDMRRGEDDVVPQLDRSVFNESAGGRPHRASDPVSHSIVHYVKHFLNGDDNPPPPPPLPPQPQEDPDASRVVGNSENHRVELQEVNGRGEKVDLIELGKNGDELFAEGLRRRTEGLESEEGALGFLSGLDGQWCSRRKKRKYIDAAVIGDALPVGWKLLLGLRRRDYRVTVYCRRFISPTGQQFMSCKGAAAYLKSQFRGHISSLEKNGDIKCYKLCTECRMIFVNNWLQNDEAGVENLPEVRVEDAFECSKCKSAFRDRDVYMRHLLSSHQKTAKRYRFGRPVGEGVIIKDDGRFECQFCHKVFNEKRSYSGHVGIHVRNSGKNSGEQPDKNTGSADEFSVVDQKLDNVTGFEELRFDDMEPYGFGHGQDLTSLAGSSMNLGDETGIELGFSTSVRFGPDALMLNAVGTDDRVTVCVWCRSEFSLDGIESEAPSDSIGYMCPTCKAKISGHFGGRLTMDLHDF